MTTQSAPTSQTRFLSDTVVLTRRSLRHILRSPDTIITTAITPVAMLLLFVYVFGGAIDTRFATTEVITCAHSTLDLAIGMDWKRSKMPLSRSV